MNKFNVSVGGRQVNINIYVDKNDSAVKWDSLSLKEQKNLSSLLNQFGFKLLGFIPEPEKGKANYHL